MLLPLAEIRKSKMLYMTDNQEELNALADMYKSALNGVPMDARKLEDMYDN